MNALHLEQMMMMMMFSSSSSSIVHTTGFLSANTRVHSHRFIRKNLLDKKSNRHPDASYLSRRPRNAIVAISVENIHSWTRTLSWDCIPVFSGQREQTVPKQRRLWCLLSSLFDFPGV